MVAEVGEHHALPCCRLRLIPGEWGLQGSRHGKQPTFLRAPVRGESRWVLPGAPTGSKGKSSCLGSAYTSSVVATYTCGWLFKLTFTLIKMKYI